MKKFPRAPQSKPNSKSGRVLDCAHTQMQKKLWKLTRTAQRPLKKKKKKKALYWKRGSIVLLSQDGQSCEPPNRKGREFTYTTLRPMGQKKGTKCCAACTRASMTRQKRGKRREVPKSTRSLSGAKRKEHKGSYQRWQDFSAPTRAYLLVQALDYLCTTAYRMQKEESCKKQLKLK